MSDAQALALIAVIEDWLDEAGPTMLSRHEAHVRPLLQRLIGETNPKPSGDLVLLPEAVPSEETRFIPTIMESG